MKRFVWLALAGMLAACGGGDSGSSSMATATGPAAGASDLAGCGATAAVDGPAVTADWFTQATDEPREAGQFELLTLSTLPDTVTGGQVLMAVRGLEADDCLIVTADDRDVSDAFIRSEDGAVARGLVKGLAEGGNRIDAVADGEAGIRAASLTVDNHPITGPVISGPHQEPFICRTQDAGLGEPIDGDCSIETRVQWFYRSTVGQLDESFHELQNPFKGYPADTAMTTLADGTRVPFVVRVETATINRGITRIAVLDDPAARGPDEVFEPVNWNRDVLYSFGESCGVGYHQGTNSVNQVLGALSLQEFSTSNAIAPLIGIADQLGKGHMTIHSTLTTLGVHCNDLLSAETLMMVKEHVIEEYGIVDNVVGTGGSGGAIQQWTTVDNYPGLLDAGSPILSFPDVVTTAMSPVDCGLLSHYFDTTNLNWNELEKAAASGHIGTNICRDWNDLFTDHIRPGVSCDGSVPDELIYDAETNPDGVRCTLQDSSIGNLVGDDPENGFARRPVDNIGVQYGLVAFNEGRISAEQFVDLNENIGGFDIDGDFVDRRMAMSEETAALMYRSGRVTGGGAINRTPMIDLNLYVDPIPVLGFHDQVRPYMLRARMEKRLDRRAVNSIFNGVPSHSTVYPALDAWLENIASLGPNAQRPAAVFNTRPASARDRCAINLVGTQINPAAGVTLPLGIELSPIPGVGTLLPNSDIPVALEFSEPAVYQGPGVCDTVFYARRSTRIAAGGPLAEDIIKCRLKPIDPADYRRPLTDAQMERLRQTFPDGVCDWSAPGVGSQAENMIWASIGGGDLTRDENGNARLRSLHWRVARSVTVSE